MARHNKRTVEYFSHDVRHGKTIYVLEQNFGNDGYAFWFKLLEHLGSAENHFLNFGISQNWYYFKACCRIDDKKAHEIMELLCEFGLIDKELWNKHRVVWCQNFIDRLDPLYDRRKVGKPTKKDIDVSRNTSIADINGIDADIKPQSKVKESKGSKGKKATASALDTVVVGKTLTPAQEFVARFAKLYEAMMPQEKFKQSARDFIIADTLIKKFGIEVVTEKVKSLAKLCKQGKVWFAKNGWADFTVGTLSVHWNSIVAPTTDGDRHDKIINDAEKK